MTRNTLISNLIMLGFHKSEYSNFLTYIKVDIIIRFYSQYSKNNIELFDLSNTVDNNSKFFKNNEDLLQYLIDM